MAIFFNLLLIHTMKNSKKKFRYITFHHPTYFINTWFRKWFKIVYPRALEGIWPLPNCQSGLNGNINIPLESPSKPLPASLWEFQIKILSIHGTELHRRAKVIIARVVTFQKIERINSVCKVASCYIRSAFFYIFFYLSILNYRDCLMLIDYTYFFKSI